ncbi:hypothetical protein PHYC_01119 [Phycisphaerales bacterium]|nr:hypothetical protein PHYC_01119 [Phycisphaerales bacterium]
MPTITLSEATFAKVKACAEPLVDDADSVIARVFDYYAMHHAMYFNGRLGIAKPNPIRLPIGSRELTHTRLLTATIDGRELHRPDWNSLTREMHELARKRLGSFEAVRKVTSANLRQGRFEENGYRYLPEVDFSIQGCDANNSAESSLRLAKAMSISLHLTFEWRERDDASHPGQAGMMGWDPTSRDAGLMADGSSRSWHDATKQAIERIARDRPRREFTLAELEALELGRVVKETGSKGATPEATLRRVCQELRDEGYLDFLDNDGTYRLR